VSLESRADVVVTETVGNDPFDEGILEIAWDARERMLKARGAIIPFRVGPLLVPVCLPQASRRRMRFTREGVTHWSQEYGYDLTCLADVSSSQLLRRITVKSGKDQAWRLDEPLELPPVELGTSRPSYHADFNWTPKSPTELDGFVLGSRIDLTPSTSIFTVGERTSATSSWGAVLFLLPQPLVVGPSSPLRGTLDSNGGASTLTLR
jgi:hypothetical protein